MQQPSTTLQLLSNLRSVTHHIYLLELCSSYMLHVFAHVVSYQPGAVEVQTVTTAVWVEIVLIVFLTMATVRFSQAAERRQQYVRRSHLPVVHLTYADHTCLSST